jgi:hypothetical protein
MIDRSHDVPDKLSGDWDEDKVRFLVANEHLDHRKCDPTERKNWANYWRDTATQLLKELDAERLWKRDAEKETTRLGQWNLKLREAIEHTLGTDDGRPLGVSTIKRFQAALTAKPAYDDTRTAMLEGAAATVLERLNQVLNLGRGPNHAEHETLLEIDALVESCLPVLFDGIDRDLVTENRRLRAALEAVEWEGKEATWDAMSKVETWACCPYEDCRARPEDGHVDECPVGQALAVSD